MMKSFIILFIFLNFQLIFSQKETENVTIELNKITLNDAFLKIEKATNYRFFYINKWLDMTLVSGKFTNTSIENVVDYLLKNTVLNYYISSDKRIILTQNSLIYDSLPSNFFLNSKNEAVENKVTKPIFFKEKLSQNGKRIETIRIGKKSRKSEQKTYTLSGYIKKVTNGSPIPNVVISLLNKKTNSVTNTKGYYKIKLNSGENIIELKSIGINNIKRRIIMYGDGVFSFNVDESEEMLEEVVLELDNIKEVKSAVTGVTKIDVAKIKNIPLVLGVRDILKVATTLPGITTAGEGSAGYNVRGGKSDQNLILLDNSVIYNPSHFFGIFSALNPYTTGKVTIYKGSIPAEFGGRLSSVFDIKTKEVNTQKFSGEASLGIVTSNLMIETPIKKDISSILFGARGTYSNWVLKALDNESLNKSKASFYDIILKYKHKINKNSSLEASTYYSKDSYSITSDSLYGYSNRLLSLKYNKRFNDKSNGSLILANSEYQFNIDYDGSSNANFELGYKVNETQLKLKMNYNYSDIHKFNYGISSKLYVVNPGTIEPKGNQSIISPLIIPKDKALESAAFISDIFKVNDKLSLNTGIRYSLFMGLGESSQRIYKDGLPKNEETIISTLDYGKNEIFKTYGGPEFRISARYLLSPNSSIKLGYNNTYQYIHTLSNNTTISPTDTWKLSDLNIKPQQSSQYSLGIFKNSEDNVYSLSLEGYYKTSKNILDYKVGAELLLNKTIETEILQGEGIAYGVEFLLKKTKGKLNGWLGYSYSRSLFKLDSEFNEERVNNGNFFPSNYDKPHDLSLVANYKLTKRYSVSANFAYQTGRPITYPTGNYIFNGTEYVAYSDRNQFRIPDYYRLDLGINIEGNHKIKKLAHSFWNISVYNVLGRNNPYSVFFVTEDGSIKAYKSSIFSIPIPTISYNIKF